MDLYATGFNAWNQLEFDYGRPRADATPEPRDFTSFARILSAEVIEPPTSGLSYTLSM